MKYYEKEKRGKGVRSVSVFDWSLFDGLGGPILGENHTGIATVAGILGIGFITTSKRITT
jgi:hypothetical protein